MFIFFMYCTCIYIFLKVVAFHSPRAHENIPLKKDTVKVKFECSFMSSSMNEIDYISQKSERGKNWVNL